MPLRRTLVLSAASAAVACALFAAGTAVGAGDPADTPSAVQRVEQYYQEGPSADYSGDSGGIGVPSPISVTVPDGGTGTAVVTMSFDYRTRGGGPFITTLGVKHSGAKVPVQPGHMALAPSSTLTATTVRSVVPDLAPGETYKFFVGVNSAFAARGHNSISTSKMVVTVDIR